MKKGKKGSAGATILVLSVLVTFILMTLVAGPIFGVFMSIVVFIFVAACIAGSNKAKADMYLARKYNKEKEDENDKI